MGSQRQRSVTPLTVGRVYNIAEVTEVKGQQIIQEPFSLIDEEGVMGAGISLTRPYHLLVTDEAPELGGRVDVLPLPQAELQKGEWIGHDRCPAPTHTYSVLEKPLL